MNRFLILLAAFLFAFQVSNAQTEEGDQTLGINLGFRYAKSDNFSINPSDNSTLTTTSKNTAFNVGPNYSYFIADKLDIGANLDFSYNNANYGENSNPSAQSTRNYGGMIYIRKYFMFQNKLGVRTGPYLGYTRGDTKYTYIPANAIDDFSSKTDNYSAGAMLDLVYYPSKKLGVSATLANLGYNHYHSNNASQGNSNGDSVNFNFINNGLNLSVFYAFGAK